MLDCDSKLFVSHIVSKSEVNGPGSRLVVWLAPCYRRCAGCFNTGDNLKISSKPMSAKEILSKAEDVKGISVSGGEPFYQDNTLCFLLKESKKRGLDTLVYTGYTYTELCSRNFKSLRFCDYLLDGRFIANFASNCKYTGSGNQRLLLLNNGKIKEDLTLKYTDDFNKFAEIFITSESIMSTGLLDVL